MRLIGAIVEEARPPCDERIDQLRMRRRLIQETLGVLQLVHPANHPSAEDIALLHELHARHERQAGREDTAAAADLRAYRVRRRNSPTA